MFLTVFLERPPWSWPPAWPWCCKQRGWYIMFYAKSLLTTELKARNEGLFQIFSVWCILVLVWGFARSLLLSAKEIPRMRWIYTRNNVYHYLLEVSIRSIDFIFFGMNYIISYFNAFSPGALSKSRGRDHRLVRIRLHRGRFSFLTYQKDPISILSLTCQ